MTTVDEPTAADVADQLAEQLAESERRARHWQTAWEQQQEQMRGGLARALAEFQADLPVVEKRATAKVSGKDGKQGYEYGYADLADVANTVLPALGRHGLSYTTKLNTRERTLVCQLRHVGGEFEESLWLLPDTMDPKVLGSHITYGRRYCLLAMTGVHPAGEDDDGDR